MLDLKTRVGLHEKEPALIVHQELERARVAVLHGLGRVDNHIAELPPLLLAERGRRRLFNQLLVASLDRALALSEVHDGAVMIAKHLHFDVPRIIEILLNIDIGHAERRFRLAPRGTDGMTEFPCVPNHAHAASSPAGHGFHDDGKADGVRELQRLFFALDRAVGAREQGQTGLLHGAPRTRLVAHEPNDCRIGTDEPDVARFAHLGEIGRFGQEAVPRMDRIGAGYFGGADDARHVQVAFAAPRGPYADVLVGEADVQRILVGL